MRTFFKKLHKWLSIPVGIIITIMCLTGAILVFQDEILELSNPEHYFVSEVKGSPIPLEELIPIVNAQLGDNTVTDVKISDDPNRTYSMSLTNGFRVTAFVNQYTGQLTGKSEYQKTFFYKIMTLHRWLMDGSRTWGKYTVGISTLIFVFILISGFIIWMPKKLNKSRFKIQFRKGAKRLFFDLHNVLGVYACLVLLICALTGLVWSFDWYRDGVFKLFGAEVKQEQQGGHGGKGRGGNRGGDKEKKEVNVAQWQTVVNGLQQSNPDYEYIRIQDGVASVHLKSSAVSRATDKYDFDKLNGEITKTTLFKDQDKTSKIRSWVYSLHVGDYWGIWSKIFTCLLALAGASLPITGYYMFFVKRKKKKRTTLG